MSIIDRTVFNQNLLLTQAFCEQQLKKSDKHIASILRSFNPVYNGRPIFTYKIGRYVMMDWNQDPLDGINHRLYDELFESQLKHKKEIITELVSDAKFEGRILIADIDESLPDGASHAESEGFIDMNDCPPIDTWFYMVHGRHTRILYAWIPQQFVHLVQDGIDVNALDIFYWQDDYKDSRYFKQESSENTVRVATDRNNGLKKFWVGLTNLFRR